MYDGTLAGGQLYGKWLFTWLSLVMSLLCLILGPPDVLDDIWD